MTQPESAPLVVGPMGVGQVVDASLTLIRRNFGYLLLIGAFGLAASVFISVLAETAYGSLAGVNDFSDLLDGDSSRVFATLTSPPYWVLTVLSSLASTLGYGALLVACGRLIERPGERLTTGQAYAAALGRVLWTIPLFILMALAGLLFIIPPLAIWVFVGWTVALPVLFIEGRGPLASLGRSRALVRGAWWHTFGVVMVTLLVTMVLSLLLGLLVGVGIAAALVAGGPETLIGVTLIGTLVVSIVTAPLLPAFGTVLLYELRARSEGFDLVQRAQ